MIIVLIPSYFEGKHFMTRLDGWRGFRIGKADCVEGKIKGELIVAGVIGMGPPHAAKRAERIIEEVKKYAAKDDIPAKEFNLRQPQGVILCGFAGALHPELKRGDLFVTAGGEHFLPHLPEADRPREAKLHTADKLAGTAAAKKELHARTGAWLVDMEQAQIAEVAAAAGLPFLGLRIVSDEAHEEIPHEALSRAYDQEEGEYTPIKLAGHLTRNPFKVKQLVSFVRPLPLIRNRMSDHLHTWLMQTSGRIFQK